MKSWSRFAVLLLCLLMTCMICLPGCSKTGIRGTWIRLSSTESDCLRSDLTTLRIGRGRVHVRGEDVVGHWRGGEVHEFFEAASYPYDTTGEQVLQIESNGQVDDVPYILTGDTLTLNGFHYDKPTSFFTYGVYVRVGSPEADAVMEEWEELQVTAKAQWDSYYTEEIQQDQARECLYMRGLLSSAPFRYLRALETGVLGDGEYAPSSDMTEAERQALRAKLAAKMRSDFRAVETLDDMVRVLIENSKTKDGWGEWSIMQPDELESFECQAGGTITVTFEDDTFETDASCLPTFECSVHGSSE